MGVGGGGPNGANVVRTCFSEEVQQLWKVLQRHPGPSVRVPERRLQEGREAGEGLAHLHQRGHRPDGLLHPQRGGWRGGCSWLRPPPSRL